MAFGTSMQANCPDLAVVFRLLPLLRNILQRIPTSRSFTLGLGLFIPKPQTPRRLGAFSISRVKRAATPRSRARMGHARGAGPARLDALGDASAAGWEAASGTAPGRAGALLPISRIRNGYRRCRGGMRPTKRGVKQVLRK